MHQNSTHITVNGSNHAPQETSSLRTPKHQASHTVLLAQSRSCLTDRAISASAHEHISELVSVSQPDYAYYVA